MITLFLRHKLVFGQNKITSVTLCVWWTKIYWIKVGLPWFASIREGQLGWKLFFWYMFCSRNSTGLIFFTHQSVRFWDLYLIFFASITSVWLYQKRTSGLVGCRVSRWSDNASKRGSPPPTDRKMAMVSASSAQLTTYPRRVKLIRKRVDDFRALLKTIFCTEKNVLQFRRNLIKTILK